MRWRKHRGPDDRVPMPPVDPEAPDPFGAEEEPPRAQLTPARRQPPQEEPPAWDQMIPGPRDEEQPPAPEVDEPAVAEADDEPTQRYVLDGPDDAGTGDVASAELLEQAQVEQAPSDETALGVEPTDAGTLSDAVPYDDPGIGEEAGRSDEDTLATVAPIETAHGPDWWTWDEPDADDIAPPASPFAPPRPTAPAPDEELPHDAVVIDPLEAPAAPAPGPAEPVTTAAEDAAVAESAPAIAAPDEPPPAAPEPATDVDTTPGTPAPVEAEPAPTPPVVATPGPARTRALRNVVARSLAEDLGDRGDVTTRATVSASARGVAQITAHGTGTVAGTAAMVEAFAQVDPRIQVEVHVFDGQTADPGTIVATVRGPLRGILTAERVALNLLSHLSGVATSARAHVDAVRGTACTIRDTRKTTPGLRELEKAAVRSGGGTNHRIGLFDAILIKDNHVAAAGGIAAAMRAALSRAEGLPVQVEVDSPEQLREALEAGATEILLDNFGPEDVRRAVAIAGGRARLEASGGITLDNVRDYAEAGADSISVGAITHSAPALDVGLDVVATEGPDAAPLPAS